MCVVQIGKVNIDLVIYIIKQPIVRVVAIDIIINILLNNVAGSKITGLESIERFYRIKLLVIMA